MKSELVILAIDVQRGFLTEQAHHILPVVVSLIRSGIAKDIPIVATRFLNHDGSPFVRLMDWKKFMSPPATDLAPEVSRLSQYVIDKSVYSSLTSEFEHLRQQEGWKTFILCGIATEGCVLKTAVDLFERDLTPIVVHDACASHDGDHYHQIGLELIERYVGSRQIVNINAALSFL